MTGTSTESTSGTGSSPKPPADRQDRSSLGRLLRRITSSTSEWADQELQKTARQEGAQRAADCEDREMVRLRGYLASVTVNPPDGERWLEAEFTDGSGTVHLVWMGRRTIPGIDAGRHLRIAGRISYVDGRRTIYNPHYELLAGA